VNSSYRDYDEQMKAYNAYNRYAAGTGPWAPYALHPDKSWHCKGLAVDAQRYNVTLAEYGWTQTALAIKEWWHLDYIASRDRHVGEPAGGGSTPFPTPSPNPPAQPVIPEGADVFGYWLARLKGDKTVWIMNPFAHTKRAIGPTEKAAVDAAYLATTGKALTVVEYTDASQINGYSNVK
jgi:hypothetical protein